MKRLLCITAVVFGMATLAQAEELKSGLETGKAIGAFNVTKISGAEKDGVDIGKNLCYRCKYGARPMVMVFARTADKNVAELSKALDKAVAEHSDAQLRAFINLLGEDREKAEAAAKQFGTDNKLANVPVVVPDENANGPANYAINPKAEVTIIIAKGGKVISSQGLAAKDLDKKAIQGIVGAAEKSVQ